MKAFLLKTSLASLLAVFALSIAVFSKTNNLRLAFNYLKSDETALTPVEEFTVNVYPNPNNGKFDILTSGQGEIKEVIIYNIIGEKVFHQLFDDIVLKADISNLEKGLYMAQVYNKSQNKMLTKRFYIE
ncbi:MAG: T9SS type A sorting domain-containing protein [Bacteroidia bacterium]